MMKKIFIIGVVLLLTIGLVACGGQKAKHIGNPYVPNSFELDSVIYMLEDDNIIKKLKENGWDITPEKNKLIVSREHKEKINKTQYETVRDEFLIVLKKDTAQYSSIDESVIDYIEFENGKLDCKFNVSGIKLDTIFEDTKRKFGDNGKYVAAQDNSPITLTYEGKTRKMIIEFKNWRLHKYVFFQ